jgi:modulator of FtsH protease HflK
MPTPRNPFEHHHDHGFGDDHNHAPEALDPAQKSLADALRVSFFVLKLVMLVLLVLYLVSGTFTVGSDQVAVRLRFGRIVELEGGRKTLAEGIHLAWPYPIEQHVLVPRSPRRISINKPFWYEVDPKAKNDEIPTRPLNPEKDGSLLTGDANIVHARWSLSYKITDPVDFITNVGDPQSAASIQDAADEVVTACAEQGIVYAVAQLTADRIQKGLTEADFDIAKRRTQAALDAMGSGISIDSFSATKTVFPGSVRQAFQAVIDAENEKAQAIEKAEEERRRVLGETAGEAHDALLELVEQFELASQSDDKARESELQKQLDQTFMSLKVNTPRGDVPIGGKVAEIINQAKAYRTEVAAQVRAEAEYFEAQLVEYEKNPGIVRNRLWNDMLGRILTGDVETFWVPGRGQVWIDLNRDPEVHRKREEEARKQKQGQQQQNKPPRP